MERKGELILEVSDLTVRYGPVEAVRGVSFQCRRGEVVALLGRNGAGKSSTLTAIARASDATHVSGLLSFCGEDLMRASAEDAVQMGLSLVPEGRHIFPALTVRENLEVARGTVRPERRATIEELMDVFPALATRLSDAGGLLSGGQQQQLAIARSLAQRPILIMLDEPSLGLAPAIVKDVMSRISRLSEDGTGVVLVEQNAELAMRIADYSHVMQGGRLVLSGSAESPLSHEEVAAIYLGREFAKGEGL